MDTDIIPTMLPGLAANLDNVKSMANYQNWKEFLLSPEMINSYIFLIVSLILYFGISKANAVSYKSKERKKDKDLEESKDEINRLKVKKIYFRNALFLWLAIGFFLIWKDEIKTTFFSISFAIMAIVVLFKEILFNILSTFVISFSKPYNIGDIIEYKNMVGTVIDRTILNTKILLKKDGINTGQEFIVPNSAFITSDIVVLTKFGYYTTHYIDVHVNKREDLLISSQVLLDVAEDITINEKQRGDRLDKWKNKLKQTEGIDIPSHKPFVTIHAVEKPYLTLKFTCDYRIAFRLKQVILQSYLERIPLELAKDTHDREEEINEYLKLFKNNETENEQADNNVQS